MSSDTREESLLAWVASFPPYSSEGSLPKLQDFRDGIILGKLLRETVDPSGFSDVSANPADPTPLATILAKMKRYLAQQEHGHVIPYSLAPNPGKILSSGDEHEICKLLQLLLVCAVNAPSGERSTTNILRLSQDYQHELMSAIQEIQGADAHKSKENFEMKNHGDVHLQQELNKAHHEMFKLKDENTILSESNEKLQTKLHELTEEMATVIEENKKLRLRSTDTTDDTKSVSIIQRLLEQSKMQVDKLREENMVLENSLDDANLQLAVFEKELQEAHVKLVAAAGAEEEIQKMKDEIDCLQETAAKVSQYEQSLKGYKTTLQEVEDLRQRLKFLEETNAALKQKNLEITEDRNKGVLWKTQLDSLKTELVETQIALSQESRRALLAESTAKASKEAEEHVKAILERLHEDNAMLGNKVESIINDNTTDISSGQNQKQVQAIDSEIRLELLQKIYDLEAKNERLQKELKTAIDANPSEEGTAVLLQQLRKYELELQESAITKGEEMEKIQNSFDEKIAALQSLISAKDTELKVKQTEYDESLANLKNLILYLGPLFPEGALSDNFDKNAIEEAFKVRELEEQLLASTFYNFGVALHHNAAETSRESILQRQRRDSINRWMNR